METIDRRVRRSQRLLGDALVSLILEKGYDAITIKDITDRADVAHATFYRHYRDKDELLTKRLEEIIGELEAMTQEPTLRDAEGYLIFKHAQEHSALYRILLSSEGTAKVRKRIRESLAAKTLATCEPLRQANEDFISASIAANHIAASLLSLIEWWLEHDMPYPPYHMAQVYARLVTEATLRAALEGASEQK